MVSLPGHYIETTVFDRHTGKGATRWVWVSPRGNPSTSLDKYRITDDMPQKVLKYYSGFEFYSGSDYLGESGAPDHDDDEDSDGQDQSMSSDEGEE
jgi:hypothetical protein